MSAWASHQLLKQQQANRARAKGSHDHILLHGQSVRDDERLYPHALTQLQMRKGEETGEKRSRAATCKRRVWNWTTMRWQAGHESELRAVKARSTLQRAASKLPFLREESNFVVLCDGYRNLACITTCGMHLWRLQNVIQYRESEQDCMTMSVRDDMVDIAHKSACVSEF
jgi:hypothetical protein